MLQYCTCHQFFVVWATARQQHYFGTTILCQRKLSGVFPNPPSWTPKQILHTMYFPTHGTYRPTPQRNMAVPPFAGHVTAQESVIVTLYLQPEKCVCDIFCSFAINFVTTCDRSEWVSFWSSECIVFKLHVSRILSCYWRSYVYKFYFVSQLENLLSSHYMTALKSVFPYRFR